MRHPFVTALCARLLSCRLAWAQSTGQPLTPPQNPSQALPPEPMQRMLQEFKEHGMSERVQFLSFDWRTLQTVQKLTPGMATVYITAQLAALDNLGIKSGQPSAWTVNDRQNRGQMLDLGVDGLVTARPDIAAALLK